LLNSCRIIYVIIDYVGFNVYIEKICSKIIYLVSEYKISLYWKTKILLLAYNIEIIQNGVKRVQSPCLRCILLVISTFESQLLINFWKTLKTIVSLLKNILSCTKPSLKIHKNHTSKANCAPISRIKKMLFYLSVHCGSKPSKQTFNNIFYQHFNYKYNHTFYKKKYFQTKIL
jgi:hypothetical protein